MNADVLNALCQAATEIHSLLQAGKGLTVAGDLNATGDKQLELDLVADRILVEHLSQLDCVRFIASEERPELLRAGDGDISVTLDPLDGSKAAMFGIPPGTIFALFQNVESVDGLSGRNVIASGFFVYGAALELFLADEHGYRALILDPSTKDWIARPVPEGLPEASVLALNAANFPEWEEWFQHYYESKVGLRGTQGASVNLRWFASMVSDVKRLLLQGGLFGYPKRARSGYEDGHLRLIYEAIPMAYLVEQAGGRSSDGTQSLLDVPVASVHQKVPVYLGEADKVAELEGFNNTSCTARSRP